METIIASLAGNARVIVLSGAGLSAASGIPTFRGKDGYWTVGSEVYRPEHLATNAAFRTMPREVWRWYLYRRSVCLAADPNPAHAAVAELERKLGDRFHLVSQNVDGLHLRAGNSRQRTFEIHGDINFMRCLNRHCDADLQEVPASIPRIGKEDALDDEVFASLCCNTCCGPTRPHVLWFDEYYDERLFRAESALQAADRADLLITIGTSGTTNLPHQIAAIAFRNGAAFIDINPERNPFAEVAEAADRGVWIREPSVEAIPRLVAMLD